MKIVFKLSLLLFASNCLIGCIGNEGKSIDPISKSLSWTWISGESTWREYNKLPR